METSAKVAWGVVGLGFLWYFWRRAAVEVVSVNPNARSVTYKMKINGEHISDTFFLGDQPNIVPVGDSDKHYFFAMGNATTGVVEVGIGYYDVSGALQGILSKVISF